MNDSIPKYKPFLKWAGGKNWLVKSMPSLLNGVSFNAYHEPFLGGGAIFFAIAPEKAYLSDLNEDLIDAYIGLRDYPERVIDLLTGWPVSEDEYYRIRNYSPRKSYTRAARFIYLNRTSFNGLYRVNRSGEYNVPYGHNDSYQFDIDRIRKASFALQSAVIEHREFEQSLDNIAENDLVFLDPPYTVSHNKNGFIEYNKTLFSIDDQKRLKKFIDEINERGAFFILTNAAHQVISDIFDDEYCKCFVARRNSSLGGANAVRGKTEEFIFTNIDGAEFGVCNE